MSIIRKTVKEGSWFAGLKILSQVVSWCITIIVARILNPDDYGLMAVSTIVAGYVLLFKDLGLGASIIQKQHIDEEDLSSIFWFCLCFSLILFGLCFFAAYPAARYFRKPSVIPIMQVISIIFIPSGLGIVPSSLLRKNIEFRKIGIIDLSITLTSSATILGFAYVGFGVWSLVAGFMIRSFMNLLLVFKMSGWLPGLHFRFKKIIPYLKFGATVALSGSLFYLKEQTDVMIAGRFWSAGFLGYYSFAIDLSKIPTDRIMYLVQQVSYPLFASLQDEIEKFAGVYLNLLKFLGMILTPVYVGGYLLAEDLVRLLLDEKWLPIIFLFKYLCLIQIVTGLSAINGRIHVAQGRPHYSLYYHAFCATLMPISFYLVMPYGLKAILIPWFTTYFLINLIWNLFTIKKLGIPIFVYLKFLSSPFLGSISMGISMMLFIKIKAWSGIQMNLLGSVLAECIVGGLCYLGFIWLFEKEYVINFYNLAKR